MSSTIPPPIVFEIFAHDAKMMKTLLAHAVSLDVEDNINILKIGGTTEKSYENCQSLRQSLEMSNSTYPFHGEAKADASSSTSKWRSAYLDYHMALTLHDSSFTEETQITTMKDIKRTWAQFREKKPLKEVQQLTGRRMHEVFCADGDNMCGGPFEHRLSDREVLSAVIKQATGKESVQQIDNAGDAVANSMATDDISHDNQDDAAISQESSDVILIDVDAGDKTTSRKAPPRSRAGKLKQDGNQNKSAITPGSSSKKTIEVINVDAESSTDEIASRFEDNIDSKKNSKERRQLRKPKVTKAYGKKKATALPAVESDNDDAGSSKTHRVVPLEVEEILSEEFVQQEDIEDIPTFGQDVEDYDDVLLPSVQEGWESWTKMAFEDGNSHVFLKLATWMLMRFRQLTNTDMDAEIDGLIIPNNPRTMAGIDEDHFFEALGMERMYTAIVHMETSPRYMCHLFHALGKVMASTDISASNPRFLPCNSPPAVEAQMISDMDIPWIGLKNNNETDTPPWSGFTDVTDDDADGSLEDEDVAVTSALDSMIIDDRQTSVRPTPSVGDAIFPKRKRTSSQVSPPKKDGGRGPAKRRRDAAHNVVQSTSPIQSLTDVDESGFLISPVVPQLSSISNGSSPRDDASVLLEPWDDDTNAQVQMSVSPERQHENANPQQAPENVIDIPTSPVTSGVGVPPSSPVVLVPDSESSQRQRSRHTTPALPPTTSLAVERSLEESVAPGTSLIVGPIPCQDGGDTNSNTHSTAQDHSETLSAPLYSSSLQLTMRVPLEILVKIFTLATRTRGGAASWILCHWKTKNWFEKLLYEKVVLVDDETASSFLQCLRRRHMPEKFAQASIKAISLSNGVQFRTGIEILSLCTSINTLAIIPDDECFHDNVAHLLQVMDALPLQVLSLQICVHLTSSLISGVTFFAKLTHLEVDACRMLCDVDLKYLPQLTHLAIWNEMMDDRAASLTKRLLSHPTLEVLIFRVDYHRDFVSFLDRHMLHDPRIVLVPSRVYAWDDLGRASMLLWELADEAVKLPEPNHNKHRCFTRTMQINRIKDYMNAKRVPEHHLDYEVVPCRIIGGGDNTSRWGYIANMASDVTTLEEAGDAKVYEEEGHHDTDEQGP
ncbi:hypothetical protein DFJ58DRAFT_849574 [Suillus subalutaceus]|uniref:uncharacterized protein n=1 Tax=Suillus subalutaceus TaxID=48586 RepID=UPI001B8710C0|nr:uncharacterized protein DFJ58DRAFT_849574 [Suillus subalutaceus]KAG1825324.1 hypothetical protein DFJ58DRAFT_849574 [Suillus subalutaceus]